MDLKYNKFQWVNNFAEDIQQYHNGEITLRSLANSFVMLGCGKILDENGSTLIFPSLEVELEMNEIIHHMLKDEGVLGELRGFLTFDCSVPEDIPLEEPYSKICSAPFDQDLVEFLRNDPNPLYFTKNQKKDLI
jgi:hypothetical protein